MMMKQHILKSVGVLTACFIAMSSLAGCPFNVLVFSSDPVTEGADLLPGERLNIQNAVGTISVSVWDREEVVVRYTKTVTLSFSPWSDFEEPQFYLDEVDVSLTQSLSGVSIETAFPSALYPDVDASVKLEITAPAELALIIAQNVGSVTVEDVTGTMDISVDVGNIEVNHPDELRADESLDCEVNVGNIEIGLPDSSAFVIDGEVEVGHIDGHDFELNVEDMGFVGAQVNDSVGDDGAAIVLRVDVGDINIEAL
jgi:hypothetical protein